MSWPCNWPCIDNQIPLYLIFTNIDKIIEESNRDKYLIFACIDKNKELLKKHTELWIETKNSVKAINGSEPIEYNEDFMKIRFESDGDLLLGKLLSIPSKIIVSISVF